MNENVAGIPGLYKVNNFISEKEHDRYLVSLKDIHEQIDDFIKNSPKDLQISQYHNLTSQESFQKVKVDQDGKPIYVEVFEKYGEEGHMLVYCKNSNIPPFISNELYDKFNQDLLKQIVLQNVKNPNSIDWRITLNYYTPIENGDSKQYSGFPFHRDIASNGNLTAILSLGDYGLLHFKESSVEYEGFSPRKNNYETTSLLNENPQSNDADQVKTILVEPNSLIIMTGPSRWNYLHRVVPTGHEFEFENQIYKRSHQRLSIVLGCK